MRNELEIGKVLYELSGRAVLHFFPLNDYDVQKRDMSPGVGGAKHRNKRTNIPSKWLSLTFRDLRPLTYITSVSKYEICVLKFPLSVYAMKDSYLQNLVIWLFLHVLDLFFSYQNLQHLFNQNFNLKKPFRKLLVSLLMKLLVMSRRNGCTDEVASAKWNELTFLVEAIIKVV